MHKLSLKHHLPLSLVLPAVAAWTFLFPVPAFVSPTLGLAIVFLSPLGDVPRIVELGGMSVAG